MKQCCIVMILFCISIYGNSQASVFSPWAVNEEIKYSIEENKRQEKLLTNQETNTAVEMENKSKVQKLKDKLNTIKQRFEKFSILIDVVKVGQEASRSISNIKMYQSYCISSIQENTSLINSITEETGYFVDQSESVLRYLVAVSLSYGQVMGMDNGDRKMILNYIVSELKSLEMRSQNMYIAIKRVQLKNKLEAETFRYYVNKDVQLVKDIIQNAKKL